MLLERSNRPGQRRISSGLLNPFILVFIICQTDGGLQFSTEFQRGTNRLYLRIATTKRRRGQTGEFPGNVRGGQAKNVNWKIFRSCHESESLCGF